MAADVAQLCVSQPALLRQRRDVDGDLPQVMEARGGDETVGLAAGQLDRTDKVGHVLRHAIAVGRRRRVALVDHRCD